MTPSDKLNKALRRRRLKANLTWLLTIAILALLLTLGILNVPKEKNLVYGVTVSLGQHQSKYDRNPFWVTRLETGALVRVYNIANFRFVKDQKLELLQIKSENGITKYRLSKILEKSHDKLPTN
jgi:hypothetical protein